MRGKAFIEYETAANAKKALAATNESTLDGRKIWVEYSGQSGSSAARTNGASNSDGG
jgi:RNA recognition motif-containing protein